jgi:uroporphyrinogen III methyltransferase/synthase
VSAAGIVYFVGAGPGDPGLLTLRGGELLVTADAVVHDQFVNPALLALASVQQRDSTVELYEVGTPKSARQEETSTLLVRLANDGKRVVRLIGGDPFVFGRGSAEAQALANSGIRFEIVPGVTAGIAAAAYAGIPVTHRGLAGSVTLVRAHDDPDRDSHAIDWSALARTGGTIVLYMNVDALRGRSAALVHGGMPADTPAAAVQWGTGPRQRTVVATLATLADVAEREGLSSPVVTIIGPVVSLRREIAWFDRRPLFGKRIVVTRARSQAASLSDALAAAGAEVIEMPATRIEPADPEPLRNALARLSGYDWVIFTSQNAVRILWDTLRAESKDARAFAGVNIAAVGPATASALLDRGLAVDVAPDRFVAEALLDELRARGDMRGARVLYAAAEGARETLQDGLEKLGAVVNRIVSYRSVPDGAGADELRQRLLDGDADLVTFTAASAVAGFVSAVGSDAARRVGAASIGPVTSDAARRAGLDVVVEATESTVAGLVDAIAAHYSAVLSAH